MTVMRRKRRRSSNPRGYRPEWLRVKADAGGVDRLAFDVDEIGATVVDANADIVYVVPRDIELEIARREASELATPSDPDIICDVDEKSVTIWTNAPAVRRT